MELTGEQILPCSVEEAWGLINDPLVLKECIPGCENIEQTQPSAFAAVVLLKIGPIKTRFKGDVQLCDLAPPDACRILGKGSGGIAGFAEGSADIRLAAADGGCCLHYAASAKIGGKIAQLGARLINSTAEKLAKQFFQNLGAYIVANARAE